MEPKEGDKTAIVKMPCIVIVTDQGRYQADSITVCSKQGEGFGVGFSCSGEQMWLPASKINAIEYSEHGSTSCIHCHHPLKAWPMGYTPEFFVFTGGKWAKESDLVATA